jgi:hypothetical protein
MKKLLLLITVLTGMVASAQTSDTKTIKMPNRTKDHFMIQYGIDGWTSRPDSVRTGGFSRHFNTYIMFDKPFKTNPKMSAGIGLGIGSSNIFFNNTNVNVKHVGTQLPFTIADSINHFDKFKITTLYLELPVEIRYFSNPNNMNKSWKFAIGAKVGTLLKSFSKGKNYVNRNGQSIYGPTFIEKEQIKKFFNGTSLAVTGRVGYGIIGLQGSYNVLGVLRDGSGARMNRFSFGISISGL